VERIRLSPFPADAELEQLWIATWGQPPGFNFDAVLARSLLHVCAYFEDRLIGFLNVAWDGGEHGFLLDTSVHPDHRRQGIATRLIEAAVAQTKARGLTWLHVDYEPHLEPLYRRCGFRATQAGLIRLQEG
jgi:GNAT superfamily N-acetyltransferase